MNFILEDNKDFALMVLGSVLYRSKTNYTKITEGYAPYYTDEEYAGLPYVRCGGITVYYRVGK